MKQVLFGKDAHAPLLKGIDAVANAVRVTAGPRGKTVIINSDYGLSITKDGVTVAKAVQLEDSIEMAGAMLMKEVAIETVKEAGDGTTTAVILAQKMIAVGLEVMGQIQNPAEMINGMNHVVEHVSLFLKENSRQITKEDMLLLKHVAVISANGSEEIGQQIFDAYSQIGINGKLMVEQSSSTETYVKPIKGIELDRGYLSHHFINDPTRMRVQYNSPAILVCDFPVTELGDITKSSLIKVMEYCAKNAMALIVIAPDISGEAIAGLVLNKQRGSGNFAAVKAPYAGEKQKEFLQDICVATGAVMIELVNGGFKNRDAIAALGKCETITITKDSTTIGINTEVENKDLAAHIKGIEQLMEDAESDSEKKYYGDRVAVLNGNISILYVGGVTETEMAEKRDRVDDAVQAVKCAIEEGVVPGGATMYLRALVDYTENILPGTKLDASFGNGQKIIIEALSAPFNQLLENSGLSVKDVPMDKIASGKVYNFKDFTFVEATDNIILDPVKVERVALENAASIAGVFLQTAVFVNHK